ncbi:CoA transferase subunit A [Pacificimonas sp. ICDLI1SI03]
MGFRKLSAALDKRLTADAAIETLRDGMTIGIGGWGPRRKPMSLVRAIIRSDLKDLTIVAYGGPEIGMLLASGKVKKLVYGFVSMDLIPADPFFRQVRQNGGVDARELDEGLLQWGLRAAGMRVPFLPTRTGLGSDVMTVNPDFRTVTSPYDDGEVLLAMPAIHLDVALLHANVADRLGNTLVQGADPYFDEYYARAAERTYVSAEKVVERIAVDADTAKANRYERCFVTGVVEAPGGAHPTSNPDDYGWDVKALKAYAAAADAEDGWQGYRDTVIGDSEADYFERFGGTDAVSAIPLPVF